MPADEFQTLQLEAHVELAWMLAKHLLTPEVQPYCDLRRHLFLFTTDVDSRGERVKRLRSSRGGGQGPARGALASGLVLAGC